ncbi:MAG: IPT/TIG domain-containing protein [Actinobacteria bacterium]|nr:IPT/TIG domain-containing protein [Actinomycetota bacterium]
MIKRIFFGLLILTTLLTGVLAVTGSYATATATISGATAGWSAPSPIPNTLSGSNGSLSTSYGLSCASQTFCVYVEANTPQSLVWDGTTWRLPATNAALQSVVCASTTFCMAGVEFANSVVVFNGSTWSAKTTIPVTPNSISCASSSFCVAAANDGQGDVSIYNGSSWSPATPIDPPPSGYAVLNTLTSVSCPSSSFCVAVDVGGNAITYSSGTWSTPLSVDGSNTINSVSCVSASFCVAVDDVGNELTYTSSGWSVSSVDTSSIAQVSCTSVSSCVAVDAAGNILTFNGSSWSSQLLDSAAGLAMVSCVTGFCLAIDLHNDFLANPLPSYPTLWSVTNWSSPVAFPSYDTQAASCVSTGSTAGCDQMVSCSSDTFCMFANYGSTFYYNGSNWSSPIPNNLPGATDAISCASSVFCVAVDNSGHGASFNGTAWTLFASVDGSTVINTVSCPSPVFCVAGDDSGDVVVFNGTSWSVPSAVSPVSITSVSCPSSSFCALANTNGQVVFYNSGSWSAPVDVDTTGSLSGLIEVSCSSLSFCVAIDDAGNEWTYNGISFQLGKQIAQESTTGISCGSSSICMTTAYSGNVIGWDGTLWSYPTNIDPSSIPGLRSISCPIVQFCMAVDEAGNYIIYNATSNTPTLSSILPISGPASGGTTVTLTGTNFSTATTGTTVSFGSNAATSVTCSSTTSCTATSPSGTGTVSVTVTTSDGTSNALSYTYTTYSGYNSLAPYRICDTRSLSVKGTFQNQCTGKTILPGGYLTIQVVGYQGNAASGASIVPNGAMAVVLNVTEADASAPSYLTVYPAGATKPASSSLNFNQTTGAIPNLVQVSLGNTSGCSGCITVYNYNGNTDIAIDVEGYFGPVSQKGQGSFVPLTPYRICDTRSQTLSKITDQCTGKTISAGQTLSVQVSGYQGTAASPSQAVPQTGGAAVVLNVTEADSNQGGYLTVYPAGTPPVASNLNFAAGEIRPNGVIAELSPTGTVSVYNLSGSTDVIIDVVGYFTSSTSGTQFFGTVPYRICDTRSQTLSKITDQCTGNTITAGQTLSVQVSGYQGTAGSLTGVVQKSAKAVVLNVTEADATSPSYLTVYPAGASKPASSNLNFTQSSGAIPNFVTVPLSAAGNIAIYNYFGSTDVIVDVVGWYG